MTGKEIGEIKIGLLFGFILLALFNMPQLVLLIEHIIVTFEEILFLTGIAQLL